ncbi:MAG: DUF4190 domain-containing protein [Chloroflexota bacterium]|nr:MAG: DUF4190 domain-containing protein [Chloroflexota bacterium]
MAEYYPQTPNQPVAQNSTMAIVSLIAGISSWVLFPIIGAIVAIITGHMAKKEIRENMGRLSGDGMATAGLILGYANVALLVCSVCIIVTLAISGAGIGAIFSGISGTLAP